MDCKSVVVGMAENNLLQCAPADHTYCQNTKEKGGKCPFENIRSRPAPKSSGKLCTASEDRIRREKMYINVQANRDQNKYGTQEVKGKEDNDRCYKKLS